MDTGLILLQGAVVIGAILLGVRTGGIGLGLWGMVGLAILVFGFGLPPGEAPTSSTLIILSVITATASQFAITAVTLLIVNRLGAIDRLRFLAGREGGWTRR